MDDRDVISFYASSPPNAIFIKQMSDGGFRVQLDIPETEAEAIKRLMDWQGELLGVSIAREDRR